MGLLYGPHMDPYGSHMALYGPCMASYAPYGHVHACTLKISIIDSVCSKSCAHIRAWCVFAPRTHMRMVCFLTMHTHAHGVFSHHAHIRAWCVFSPCTHTRGARMVHVHTTHIRAWCVSEKADSKTCLPVRQGEMPSCTAGRHVFLSDKKTCLLVQQEDMSSCSTRRHVFLFTKKTCLLVQQEDMSSG